jgi:hypothetical protein
MQMPSLFHHGVFTSPRSVTMGSYLSTTPRSQKDQKEKLPSGASIRIRISVSIGIGIGIDAKSGFLSSNQRPDNNRQISL